MQLAQSLQLDSSLHKSQFAHSEVLSAIVSIAVSLICTSVSNRSVMGCAESVTSVPNTQLSDGASTVISHRASVVEVVCWQAEK